MTPRGPTSATVLPMDAEGGMVRSVMYCPVCPDSRVVDLLLESLPSGRWFVGTHYDPVSGDRCYMVSHMYELCFDCGRFQSVSRHTFVTKDVDGDWHCPRCVTGT